MASTANEIGRLVVTIGADLSEFTKGMKDLQAGIKKGIGKDALDLSKDLARGITAAAAAAIGMGAASVYMASNIDETTIAFTNLLGSSEKATKFIEQLMALEKKSPFKFEQLDQASRKLIAVGFSAEQIIPIFNTINDTATALKLGPDALGELTGVFDKIMMSGTITDRELKVLKTDGIDAAGMIAQKMGVDVPTAMRLISSGAVDSKTAITGLIDGMNGKFAGMADKMGDQIPHMIKHMQDTLKEIMITEGTKLESTGIGKFIKGIETSLDRLSNLLKHNGLFESLEKVFGKDMLSIIVAFSGAIAGGAVAGFIALAAATAAAWVPLLPWMALGAAVAGIAYLIWSNWKPLMLWFQETWIDMKGWGMEFIISLGKGFLWLAGVLIDNADKLFGWIPGLGDKIGGVKDKIVELKGNLDNMDKNNMSNWQKGLDGIQSKAKEASKAVKEIKLDDNTGKDPFASLLKKELDYATRAKQLKAEMTAAEDAYDLQAYMKLLNDKNAAFLGWLSEQKQAMDFYNEMQMAANKSLASIGMDAIKSVYDSLGQSMLDVLAGTTKVTDALMNMANQIGHIFFNAMIQKLLGSMMAGGMDLNLMGGGSTTSLGSSYGGSGSGTIKAFGTGGHVSTPQLAMIGDSPETIIPDSDMSGFLSSVGAGDVNITNNLINQTGTPMQSTSSVQKTSKGFIVTTVLEALALNQNGLKTAVKAAGGG